MKQYGLASSEARVWLRFMDDERKHWAETFKFFSKKPLLELASINRKLEEYYVMAQKAKKAIASAPSRREDFAWKGFIDVKLSDSEKANLLAWDVADGDIWDGLARYCAAGIKISLSFNAKNDSFTCAGTGQPDAGPNHGYCVVAYAKTPYDAARVWLFKVATILPDSWSEYDSGDADAFG